MDALREELAGSAPAATREDKLAAALAKLVKEEQKYLLWYKEARDQGEGGLQQWACCSGRGRGKEGPAEGLDSTACAAL